MWSLRNNTSDAGIAGQILLLPLVAGNLYSRHNNQHDFSVNAAWNVQTGAHWLWHCIRERQRTSARPNRTRQPDPFHVCFYPTNSIESDSPGRQLIYLRNATLTAGYQYEVENGFPSATIREHARRNNQAGYIRRAMASHKAPDLDRRCRARKQFEFRQPRGAARRWTYLLRAGNGDLGDTRLHAFYGQGIDEPRLDQSFGIGPVFSGKSAAASRRKPDEPVAGSIKDSRQIAFICRRIIFTLSFHNVISFGFAPPPFPAPPTDPCQFGTGTLFQYGLGDRARSECFRRSSG